MGLATGVYIADEALISMHAGASPWVLPGLLALAGGAAVAQVVRRLPPASRVGDLVALLCGEGIGLALWSVLRVAR